MRARANGRWGRFLVSVLCGMLLTAHGARGQEPSVAPDLERRVQELEKALEQMRKAGNGALAADSAPAPASSAALISASSQTAGQTPPDSGTAASGTSGGAGQQPAGWREGFFVQSRDKAFILKLTGQLQADYRDFLDNTDRTDVDSFLVRRARLGIEATMLKYYEFRLLPEFGGVSPAITDAYMNIHYCDDIQLQAGKFKQPFSYEQLTQDRYVPLMERSMIDQCVPARDVGVMLWGRSLLGNRLDYGVAVSNGQINGNGDLNNNKDVNGRLAYRPFFAPDDEWLLNRVQIGISVGAGVENEGVAPATLRTPLTVPWLTYRTTVRADGVRYRMSPELAWFYGPWGFATQYYHQEQELRASPASALTQNVFTDGYYFLTTCFLTGERRTDYSQQIDPIHPLTPGCFFASPGAFELLFRVSHLEVDQAAFAPGPNNLVDASRYSPAATETTLGLNWYWTKWSRMQLNWEHAWFDQPVGLAGTGNPGLSGQNTVAARMQFIF